MLVTAETNRRNRSHALAIASLTATISLVGGFFFPPVLVLLGLSPFVYLLVRRRRLRRMRIMNLPFLQRRVRDVGPAEATFRQRLTACSRSASRSLSAI
jgi:hypothetical protein